MGLQLFRLSGSPFLWMNTGIALFQELSVQHNCLQQLKSIASRRHPESHFFSKLYLMSSLPVDVPQVFLEVVVAFVFSVKHTHRVDQIFRKRVGQVGKLRVWPYLITLASCWVLEHCLGPSLSTAIAIQGSFLLAAGELFCFPDASCEGEGLFLATDTGRSFVW